MVFSENSDKIVFLGTAGARFVVARQIRASGGIWLSLGNTNILVDPGPGALVKCWSKREKLDPATLDGVVLSHRHLDHCGDVNAIVEAMTDGGLKRRGTIFAPRDALEDDPVILRYLRGFVNKTVVMHEGGTYALGDVAISTPIRHIHGAETYGMNVHFNRYTISYIADTRFFPELVQHYRGELLIVNVVRLKRSDLDHLCLDDARQIIREVDPKVAILTHFGMTMIRAKPWELAETLSQELGTKVVAARDGMTYQLHQLDGGVSP